MDDNHIELKRRLFVATCRFEQASDTEEKPLIGADVRELERLVEIAAANDPDMPKEPPRPLRKLGSDPTAP